jgi:GTP-binding protein HflX
MSQKIVSETIKKTRILIVGLITPHNKMVDPENYFEEFKSLVSSNNIEPVACYFTKLRLIDPGTFISKGKLEEIEKICLDNDIDEIILSESITPHQETALDKRLGVRIYDRSHLILEIFEKRAQSAEAKLQIEIAFLEHKKTRVAGRGKMFSQQAGGIGMKGMGETQKEVDLRHIDHLLLRLTRELAQLKKVRATQRKQRLRNQVPLISLIGYTNAGKSTLFNSLTNNNVLAADMLFATLDTTTAKLVIDTKQVGTISDTVGFIQNLPHQLIEAFHSTLEELQYANIILHVIDISNKDWVHQMETVEKVLDDLNVDKTKQIYIINKIDKLSEEKLKILELQFPQPNIQISAIEKSSLIQLKQLIKEKTTSFIKN